MSQNHNGNLDTEILRALHTISLIRNYVILETDVTNQGTDGGLMGPMYDQLGERYGQLPEDYLVDHGFAQADDVTKLEAAGTKVYMPVKGAYQMLKEGKDPYLPKKSDTKEMAQWRARMGTDAAKEIYKQRTATAEFPNACCRNHGLRQFNVRGLLKVKAVALLHALAHNFQRAINLRKQHGLALVERSRVSESEEIMVKVTERVQRIVR